MTKLPYKKLIIWQKAMELSRAIYRFTRTLPDTERYGLIAQMRSAAVSIASNIAEGSQRSTKKDFSHFLDIAKGSLAELETQILLTEDVSADRKVIDDLTQKTDELSRILFAFKEGLWNRRKLTPLPSDF